MYYIFFIFSSLFFAAQSMEIDREIISGPFGKITNSYFLDKPGYTPIFEELLKDWKFSGNTIFALFKLIDDADSSREIKKRVQEYGAEKVILPDCKIMPSALLLPQNIPVPDYRPGGSLKELTLLTILKQIELCKDEKNNYDIIKLQEIFGTSPRGLLEIMFEYPDFPENLKKPILEAAYLEYKKNVKSPIKEDSTSTLLHKEDYKTESYNLLKKFMKLKVINNELREKINMHIFMQDLPYDKKEIGELDAIVALPKIDDNSKKKIFSHVVKMRFDGKFQPLNLLQEAVRYFSGGDYYGILWNECGFKQYTQLYTWVINYTFQEYPFYTAKKLVHLAKKASNLEEKKTALALVDVHKLLQKVIDSDPTIMQNGMKDLEFCELLLFNGVKFPQEVIYDAIKTDDNKLLMLLGKYDIDFSDSKLIKIALGTKSLRTLSFLIDQQKNISQKNRDRIFKLVCERFNVELDQNIYKAYLNTKFTGNAFAFERLLLEWLKFERDAVEKQAILTDVKELRRKIACDDIEKLEDMDKIIVELSSITLLKDQNFLRSILNEVEFGTNNINQNFDYHVRPIKDLNEKKNSLTIGMRVSAFFLGIALSNFSLFNICVGLAALGSSGWSFYNYQRYVDGHNEVKKRFYLYEKLNYFEGYIRGLFRLRDESNKIIRPQEKIRILDNEISGKEVVKLLYLFSSGLFTGNTIFAINTISGVYGVNALVTIFYTCFPMWKDICDKIDYYNQLQNSLEKSKLNGFVDGLLYAKNCQNELPCNSDFYEGDNVFPKFLLENWRKNSCQPQEFEKLLQTCKQKIKPGFFKKCMNSIIARFYNKDLANKFERDTYKYSNQYLKNKIEKERKFTYATLTHNKLLCQPEL